MRVLSVWQLSGPISYSSSGFALRTGKPVISNHLENEQRFRTPELLVEHGIRRAMNVILQGDGSPYGVLEVDSRSEGEFAEHDIAFLQGAANILGMAIERQRHERQLKTALDRHQVLLKEISHRVKNSLQIVSGMLHLQASSVHDDALRAHLAEASGRVSAIGRAYERLSYDADVEDIDLGPYLQDVCADAIIAASTASWISMLYKEFSSTPIERFRWPCSSTDSSPMQSNTHFVIALTDTFGYAWFDRTKTLLSYLCATTASGCPLVLTSARAGDWECGSSRHFQNNWGLQSAIAGMSMGRSSY